MFFLARFLNSIKNYLINNVLLINYRYSSHYYRHSSCNWFNIKIPWDDFKSNFQQKKTSDEKYNILKYSVFAHLTTTIVTQSDSKPEEIPSLIFDPLGVRKSEPNHFEEAKKHFKKIKILNRFEDLEQRVNTFNENLNYEDKKNTEIVSNYLKDKGFGISTSFSTIPKENIVLINYLISALKLFWRCKEFDHIQEQIMDGKTGKKELRIKGALIITVSDKDKEREIRKCIECLKHNQTINEKYDNLCAESDRILDESKKLSSEIKLRLVDGYKNNIISCLSY